jgi:hypothetical protein
MQRNGYMCEKKLTTLRITMSEIQIKEPFLANAVMI